MIASGPHRLLIALLIGILGGALLGGLAPEWGKAVQFIGDLFLRALFVMVVPLVISSMIVGVSSVGDVRKLGGLGVRTIGFFVITTGLAVLVGLLLVVIIHPGTPFLQDLSETTQEPVHSISQTMDKKPTTIAELLRSIMMSLVPNNLFTAMVNAEVLPLIIFSLVFGSVLTTLGERGQFVIRFFEGANEAIMGMVHIVMWTAPMGVGALIAGRLGGAGGFSGFWPQFMQLGAYAATVILALMIHGMVTLPLLLQWFGKQHVWTYVRNMGTALTTAFSTSSSSATLPLTMDCVIGGHGISKRIASFVLPLGATINMNGTALYEAIAAMFIAQTYGIELGLGEMIIIFLTATLAAVGAAGIPEAGLVTMVIVLKTVNLPLEGISLLLVIDWFLDRCRTSVNVWGDAVGAAVIEQWERKSPGDS